MRGRHRGGDPAPEPYVPRLFDARERAIAAELTGAYPRWLVVWGPYWRCWSAFALFSTRPLVVHATDVNALLARMRAAELDATARPW